MLTISSKDNRAYKLACSLSEKKQRDREGCYVIEGPNLLREALNEGVALSDVFFSEQGLKGHRELSELMCRTEKETKATIYGLGASLFSRLTDTETPQGVFAIVQKRAYGEPEFFKRQGDNILVLDRLQDPGNIGTLLRTAEAAGFSGALLLKGCGDVYSPKVVRAAAGTMFRLPLLFTDTAEEALSMLKRNGKTCYATAMEDSSPIYDCKLSKGIAVIIGNEGNGVSNELLSGADKRVTIPMAGSTQSLNAAVAGGVIMYESLRQRLSEERSK